MKRTRASQNSQLPAEDQHRERTIESILSTIMMIIFGSEDMNFQTNIFAELGTSNREEIASILSAKLYASNIK